MTEAAQNIETPEAAPAKKVRKTRKKKVVAEKPTTVNGFPMPKIPCPSPEEGQEIFIKFLKAKAAADIAGAEVKKLKPALSSFCAHQNEKGEYTAPDGKRAVLTRSVSKKKDEKPAMLFIQSVIDGVNDENPPTFAGTEKWTAAERAEKAKRCIKMVPALDWDQYTLLKQAGLIPAEVATKVEYETHTYSMRTYDSSKKECPSCGSAVRSSAKFCSECGCNLPEAFAAALAAL